MYAVIQTGGKQYRVKEGDIFSVEKLVKEPGQVITFDSVLAIEDGANIQIGKPVLKGASVSVQVLDQYQDDKVIIFKKKRRHNYRRKRGHRQELTLVKVFDISASGGAKKSAPEYAARAKKNASSVGAKKANMRKNKNASAAKKPEAAKAPKAKTAKTKTKKS